MTRNHEAVAVALHLGEGTEEWAMFVGAYWSQRRESKETVSRRLSDFLMALRGDGDEFAVWFDKADSRAGALRHPVDVAD